MRGWLLVSVRAFGNPCVLKVGHGLDLAGLLQALGRESAVLAGFLIPDLRGLDAAAAYEPGTLRITAVDPVAGTDRLRLEYRFEWSAQHGCSDWSCRDTECQSDTFRYLGDAVIFERSPHPEERTTREEF